MTNHYFPHEKVRHTTMIRFEIIYILRKCCRKCRKMTLWSWLSGCWCLFRRWRCWSFRIWWIMLIIICFKCLIWSNSITMKFFKVTIFSWSKVPQLITDAVPCNSAVNDAVKDAVGAESVNVHFIILFVVFSYIAHLRNKWRIRSGILISL